MSWDAELDDCVDLVEQLRSQLDTANAEIGRLRELLSEAFSVRLGEVADFNESWKERARAALTTPKPMSPTDVVGTISGDGAQQDFSKKDRP